MLTLAAEIFGPLVVAFALFILVSGLRHVVHQIRNRQSPEQLQAARDSFRSRLIHPKAAEVEQGIGAFLPQRLIALYDDHETILTEELEIRGPGANGDHSAEWIEAFLPLDLESQKYTMDLTVFGCGKGFCFATDGTGNFYWTPMSDTRRPDSAVFFACHDPFGNQKVADSLDEFLAWPRIPHAQPPEPAS
jgi:hypothetical protein